MGDNLKLLRLKHGYSQERLCVALQRRSYNISRSTYSKYENGTLNIKISILIALKELYHCSYDDFFVGLITISEQSKRLSFEQKLRRDLKMGDNLRRLRLQHQYSQEKLCIKLQCYSCDISRNNYSKYENGTLNIKSSVLLVLKELYHCSFDEFFTGLKP